MTLAINLQIPFIDRVCLTLISIAVHGLGRSTSALGCILSPYQISLALSRHAILGTLRACLATSHMVAFSFHASLPYCPTSMPLLYISSAWLTPARPAWLACPSCVAAYELWGGTLVFIV